MIKLEQKEHCCGCQACAQICPTKCISMKADGESFLYPVVDAELCVNCGLCEKVCPIINEIALSTKQPDAYAAYNLDEGVRMASSSGGIFTLLAETILKENGVVYGAALERENVKHIRVTDMNGVALLRGSKYVQSDIGLTYLQAQEDLERGKKVLYTGTPCQIAGLKSFLRKEYKNLFAMDIICHGVPAPLVWQKYIEFREQKAGMAASKMFFRHKKYGWKRFSVFFEFANKTLYIKKFPDDLFMQAFLDNLCLRPSCYACSFKTITRVSDITVADFWGIENVCPEMDDDKGMSLILLHSKEGLDFFVSMCDKLCYKAVDLNDAIRGNPSINHAVLKPVARDAFMKDIEQEEFDKAVRRYVKKQNKYKAFMKRILRKLGLLEQVKKFVQR